MVNQSFNEAIGLAKTRLYMEKDWLFIASLCSKLQTKARKDIAYGATDGIHLYLNPDKFIELTKEEQMFLIAHETLHVAYMHMVRKDERNHHKWNCATDYVINQHLVDSGFTLIDGGLLDSKFIGMSSEQVYDLLPDDEEQDNPLDGDIIPSDDEITITSNIVQASIIAQVNDAWGNLPQDLQRHINNLTKPKVNWKTVLRRFITDTVKEDYSWLKPNRRFLPQGYYLPSLYSHGLGKLTFAIDTSGSVSDEMFNAFISELHHALKQTKPKEIEVLLFDTCIKSNTLVKSVRDLNRIEFFGYGGTDVEPVISHFNKTNSKALIVITDGYFDLNLPKCKKPLLWVIYDNPNFKPKQGKVIYYEINR